MKSQINILNSMFSSYKSFYSWINSSFMEIPAWSGDRSWNSIWKNFHIIDKEITEIIISGDSKNEIGFKSRNSSLLSKDQVFQLLTNLELNIRDIISYLDTKFGYSVLNAVGQISFGTIKEYWHHDDYRMVEAEIYPKLGLEIKEGEFEREPTNLTIVLLLTSSLKFVRKLIVKLNIAPMNNPEDNEENPTNYFHEEIMVKLNWGKSDTDLLELITALVESGSIQNSTKDLTRKEAIELFSQFLNLEIKDAESKLTRATNRKKDVAQYLTSLKNTFEEYAKDKEDRLDSLRK